ncbi:putative 2OG-Fe(II) oxygenase [Paraglaciecola sp.]|uniref:putative 2OG-Fe(II) oxygenase n=1 Tax=Paraglaciecola sp. TaxID=1920173 RepID=UPI003265C850
MHRMTLNPQQALNTAMQFMHTRKFEQALGLFLQLEKSGMNDHRLYRATGSAYERLGQKYKALQYFKRSLSLSPNQGDLLIAAGNISIEIDDARKGGEFYFQALKLKPEDKGVLYKLATNYLRLKEYSKAFDAFDKLVKLEPLHSEAIVGKSKAMGHLQPSSVTKMLMSALNAKPDDTLILRELAWCYKQQGDFGKSIQLFQRVVDIDVYNIEAFEDLALNYLDLGDTALALITLKKGLKLDFQHAKLNKLLCRLKFELAEEDYLDHYHQMPRNSMSINVFADYINQLISDGNLTKAQAELRNINPHSNKYNVSCSLQLSIWEKQKQFEQIIRFVRCSQKSNQALPTFLIEYLAKSYLGLGEGALALDTIKPLVQGFPDNQYFMALYSTALRQTGSSEYDNLCDYDNLVFQQPIQLSSKSESIDSFNARLAAVIEELHITKQQPLNQSLLGGTQTLGNLLTREHPVIQELKANLEKTSKEVIGSITKDSYHPARKFVDNNFSIGSSWSVKLNNQGYHASHIHPKGWFSSAYYVNLPEELKQNSRDGSLHMGKPGIALNSELSAERWLKPEIGSLVLFPSYFWHGTEPFSSEGNRLSVAFDLVSK